MNDRSRVYEGEAELRLTWHDGTRLDSRVYVSVRQNKDKDEDDWPSNRLAVTIPAWTIAFTGRTIRRVDNTGPVITLSDRDQHNLEGLAVEMERRVSRLQAELREATDRVTDLRHKMGSIPTTP